MVAASILEYVFITVMLRRNSKETVQTQNKGVRTRISWRLRQHHCLANSRTFQDMALAIRLKSIQ